MDIVLDSVAINHLVRKPKKTHRGGRLQFETCLDAHLASASLQIRIDEEKALVHEWAQTSGDEIVRILQIHWDQWAAIVPIQRLGILPGNVSKALRKLGFKDTIDKLILKIALETRNRIVISEDSDFWDPHSAQSRGDARAPVAKLCAEFLQIEVLTMRQLMRRL